MSLMKSVAHAKLWLSKYGLNITLHKRMNSSGSPQGSANRGLGSLLTFFASSLAFFSQPSASVVIVPGP